MTRRVTAGRFEHRWATVGRLRAHCRRAPARRLLSAAFIGATALAAYAPASSAAPGTWQQLPQSTRSPQGAQAWPLRLSDGSLDVAYPAQSAGANTTDVLTALVGPTGTVTSGPAIASGWATISNPALILQPGGIGAFFGGLHSTNFADPNQDLNYAAAPGAGGPWTVSPGSASATEGVSGDQAYASDVSAIALANGPLEAWAHTLGVTVHHGVGPATPNYDFQSALGGCCGYDPALAVDGASGQPAITWFSNATGHTGYYEQGVDPSTGAPVGVPALIPGSQTAGNSASPRARTAFTGRPGTAGLFTALAAGYPAQTNVIVWRVGSPAPTLLSGGSGSVQNVAIAVDPAARLWVVWTRQGTAGLRLFAARSNPSGTAFDTPVSVSLPPGASDSFALAASAQTNVLDVLGTFGPGPGGAPVAIWSTQLAPEEDVKVAPLNVKRGRTAVAVLRVSDAGVPLAGALVTRLTGRGASTAAKRRHTSASARTNSAGVARLKLGSFRRSTTVRLKITKAGYVTRTVTVRVRVH